MSGPTRLTWFASASLGTALLCVTAILNNEPSSIPWYLGTSTMAVIVVFVTATRVGRGIATVVLMGYATVVPLLTILAGFEVWNPWTEFSRVMLFTNNPNLLAADIVAVAAALFVILPRSRWSLALVPLIALAVIFTGSRTGFLALGAGGLAWLLRPGTGVGRRIAAISSVGAVVGLLVVAGVQADRQAASHNLLRTSVDFSDPIWRTQHARRIEVEAGVVPGPFPGSRADRIVATSDENSLLMYQPVERSEEDVSYVASVYLRADDPQTLVLSSHLRSRHCYVTTSWSRCVTRPGEGDGRLFAQFRLETREAEDSIDVYAYGPQYERSSSASEYSPKRNTLFPQRLTARFELDSLLRVDELRLATMQVGAITFLSSPWHGVGRESVGTALENSDEHLGVQHLNHTHSTWTERLAAEGLLGLIGWTLIMVPALNAVVRGRVAQFAPLLAALLVLNTLDATFFHVGSYLATWIAIGSQWHVRFASNPNSVDIIA